MCAWFRWQEAFLIEDIQMEANGLFRVEECLDVMYVIAMSLCCEKDRLEVQREQEDEVGVIQATDDGGLGWR